MKETQLMDNAFPIQPEKPKSPEKEKAFDPEFYITDHSPDSVETGNPEALEELYGDIKKDGIDSIRYDWRWKNIEPEKEQYNEIQLNRYNDAKNIMAKSGLKPPTVILSSAPQWAEELYKSDKEKFFIAYEQYVEQVKNSLSASEEKIDTVQIFNELNNPIYTKVKIEDFPKLCEITRRVFKDYNPDIKLMATVSVGSLQEASAKIGSADKIDDFLAKLKEMKDDFDIIGVDYYPGLWHQPLKEANWKFKDTFKQMGMLKKVFEEISTWGNDYELGEVGLPSKRLWGGEKAQRYFFDVFFKSFKKLMQEFEAEGRKTPSRVGLYQAIDEAPKNLMGKILRKATPFPEHDMGMRKSDGAKKMILENTILNERMINEEETPASQLKFIINYLKPKDKKILPKRF